MTVTIRVPSLRSLALVFVGAVLGATLVVPVAARVAGQSAVAPAATRARTASCAGLNFHPIRDTTEYEASGTLMTGLGFVLCDPGLPNKALVTRVRFTVRDDQVSGSVSSCALVRGALAPPAAAIAQVMASVDSTGLTETPGTVRLSDSSIEFATINNGKFAYWLQCSLAGSEVGVYGADVTYTISSANG